MLLRIVALNALVQIGDYYGCLLDTICQITVDSEPLQSIRAGIHKIKEAKRALKCNLSKC